MDFYKRMELVCQRIPRGKVATYGQIALLCGKPRNSRQVGYGLRKNLVRGVPAHRIVNSKGILSGAGAFRTPDTQRELLKREGICTAETKEGWRVELKKFVWNNSLEEAEELYRIFQTMDI